MCRGGYSAGRAAGGALGLRAASMTETVEGRIRPEPSSMCKDTLYSGMNSGSWHQARTSAGEEKGGLSGSMWSEVGVGAVWTPAKPSGLRDKTCPDHPSD